MDKIGKESIQCNGYNFLIARNLEQAIKHTRSRSAPIFLWADAICSYPDRTGTKHLRELRLGPQFCEVFDSAYLACRIGKIASVLV
jgi:hypothetical protein